MMVLALALGLSAGAGAAEAATPKPFGGKAPHKARVTKLRKPVKHKPAKRWRRPVRPAQNIAPTIEEVKPTIAPGLPAEDAPLPELGPVPVLVAGDPTLRRPYGCSARKARYPGRVTYACRGEELVTPGATATMLTDDPVIVPSELVAVFRTCPFEPVAALDAQPDRFIAYEDADVGRCYMWAPLDRAALATLGVYDRHDHLGTIHPYMAAVIRRALAESAADGDQLRVISGSRGGGKPSWHTYGLAVDVNLKHRKGLGEATAAYLRGGEERRAWVGFAATCERLGLYWLGRKDVGEIFHFEWRPGWTGLPRGEIVGLMSAAIADGDVSAAWQYTRYDATRKSAFRHLRDESLGSQ